MKYNYIYYITIVTNHKNVLNVTIGVTTFAVSDSSLLAFYEE